MEKQRIQIEVDIPHGYEPTGEYRTPRIGEVYASAYGTASHAVNPRCECRALIIRRKEPEPVRLAKAVVEFFDVANGARYAFGDFHHQADKAIDLNSMAHKFLHQWRKENGE